MVEKPPPVHASGRVLCYAELDGSVTYSGHSSLFVGTVKDGLKELGPVPCLAITQDLKTGEICLLHCDRDWEVLGLGGKYESVDQAKAKAERIYHGVTAGWIETGITVEEAQRLYQETWADEHCSFCDKIPPDVEMMVKGKNGRICDSCIEDLHRMMREEREKKE